MKGATELFIPGKLLLTNAERGMHHHALAAEKRRWRDAGFWYAKQEKLPAFEWLGLTVVPHVKHRRSQDVAACNPTVKSVLDGFVDAGVLEDDSPNFVRAITFRAPVLGSARGDGIEIILEGILK